MVIRLGDRVPTFIAQTTEGEIDFHEWLDDSWCLFFSHSINCTPVCTSELVEVAKMKDEFDKRGIKVLGLSVNSLVSHKNLIQEIWEIRNVKINFPLIADENHEIATLYDMIHPNAEHIGEAYTIRRIFILDPTRKVRLMVTYPLTIGRNFNEILRVFDALQLAARDKVVTPANWQKGDRGILVDLSNLKSPKKALKKN